MPGRTFEQFHVGDQIPHARTLTVQQADNEAFCRLTLNNQPLHLDAAYAATTSFGRIVVNGLLTMAACVGASVEETTAGTLVANLGYDDVRHPAPVFPGDTLHFSTRVADKRPSSQPGRGVVTLQHEVRNQAGTLVCHFRRVVMVRSEAPA